MLLSKLRVQLIVKLLVTFAPSQNITANLKVTFFIFTTCKFYLTSVKKTFGVKKGVFNLNKNSRSAEISG